MAYNSIILRVEMNHSLLHESMLKPGIRSDEAAIYSVMETAKENGLNPFQYLKYLFEQLPQLSDAKDPKALEPFLPWSSSLPLHCRVFTK